MKKDDLAANSIQFCFLHTDLKNICDFFRLNTDSSRVQESFNVLRVDYNEYTSETPQLPGVVPT